VNIKLVTSELGLTRNFWWHPYDATLVQAIRTSAKVLYGKGSERVAALRSGSGSLVELGKRVTRKKD
jgi:hypothetical protein